MSDGGKLFRLCVSALFWAVATGLSNSDDDQPESGAPRNGNRYDGVGVHAVPRPAETVLRRSPRAVVTTDDPIHYLDEEGLHPHGFDQYVALANQPYVTPRWTRLTEAAKNQLSRVARRYARKNLRELFKAGPEMDEWEFRRQMEEIAKIGGKGDMWQFQYDKADPVLERYDAEWDDGEIVSVGPMTVTDSGSVDFDVNFGQLEDLWKVDLEDLVVAPSPPDNRPKPLVDQQVRFRTKAKIRLSSSSFFKMFSKPPKTWGSEVAASARYAKLTMGADLYTDVLRRRYLATELEVRISPEGEWATFVNVVFFGR